MHVHRVFPLMNMDYGTRGPAVETAEEASPEQPAEACTEKSEEGKEGTPTTEPSAPPEEATTTVKHKVVLTAQELPAIKKAVRSALSLNRRMAYEIKEVSEHEDESAEPAAEEREGAPKSPGTRVRQRVVEAMGQLPAVDDHVVVGEGTAAPPPAARQRGGGVRWWHALFCFKARQADDNASTAERTSQN